MTAEFIYAADIIREIQNIEKQVKAVTSDVERTTLMNKIEHLRQIIKDVNIYYYDYDTTRVKEEVWTKDGIIHRVDGPAIVKYENGTIFGEEWITDGKINMCKKYFENGTVKYENRY